MKNRRSRGKRHRYLRLVYAFAQFFDTLRRLLCLVAAARRACFGSPIRICSVYQHLGDGRRHAAGSKLDPNPSKTRFDFTGARQRSPRQPAPQCGLSVSDCERHKQGRNPPPAKPPRPEKHAVQWPGNAVTLQNTMTDRAGTYESSYKLGFPYVLVEMDHFSVLPIPCPWRYFSLQVCPDLKTRRNGCPPRLEKHQQF